VTEEDPMLQRFAVILSAGLMVVAVACAQSDPGITTAVKAKLAADDAVKAYQIDVDTSDRVVTLTGTVDRTAAKEQAVTLARQTEGVRDVVDQITVSPQATPATGARDRAGETADRAGEVTTDASITTVVKSKFLADTTTSGLKIDVDTKGGVVSLEGTVASKAEANRAVSLARETNGVKRVINNLRVER
jgi:hyperosmotically inducible protein